MLDETSGSTVPRRQLGRYLTQLRDDAGLTVDAAADALDCSRQKIWRMEKGLVPMRALDVGTLCTLYHAPTELTEALTGVARETRAKGWWHAYGDAIPSWFSLYVGLEAAASTLRHYNAELIPGLMQTREYSTELYRLNRPEVPAAERDRTIAVRLERQRVLVRRLPAAPDLHLMLSEAVLRRPVPERSVWAEQLRHLRETAELPNLFVRVLPLAAGPPLAAETGTFTILDFPRPPGAGRAEPTTVYSESLTGALYLDRPAEVTAYRRIWLGLETMALSERQSMELIDDIIGEWS